MKKAFLLLLLFPALLLRGQTNLVPNASFEKLLKIPCNCMQGEMAEYLENWDCTSKGTSDILTDEATQSCYANPKSTSSISLGTQAPRTGHAMALIMTYGHEKGYYREYIGVTLTTPLVKGRKYYAEMYVSLADYSGYATNNLGICFFTGQLHKWSDYAIYAEPQVNHKTVINNTEGWVKVSGTFVAQDNYTYMVIGNFYKSDNTLVEKRPSEASAGHYSASPISGYYVDDVLVREKSTISVTGDTLVMVGTKATLVASGAKNYTWADSIRPKTILDQDKEMTVLMNGKKTFYVYGDGDTAKITVNVFKPQEIAMKELEGRKVKKGREITVKESEVTITVYDKDEIDGDSISLWFGDSCIVQHCKLTRKKKSFTVHMDRNHPRQLILFAENEGSRPPNTAAIIIKDGKEETNIILSSDLKSCDSVMLVYKPEDE